MPLFGSAIRRFSHMGEVSTLLVEEWRSRDRSQWGYKVIELDDMR